MTKENHHSLAIIPNSTSSNTVNRRQFDTIPMVSAGNLDEYIKFINSIPLLGYEEEVELANRWIEKEDTDAARFLVLSHLRLVVSISRSYIGYGLPLADIIQEGTIGLMKAIKRFNPNKGARLVTFATYWIKAEVNEYVIKNWRIVKTVTTKTQRKLFFNLRSKKEDIGALSEDEANRLSEELNVTRDDIVDMNMRLTGNDIPLLSYDDNDNDNSFAPIDWLTDESTTPEMMSIKKKENKLHTDGIAHALLKLDERSQDIIKSRWLCNPDEAQTLQDMARKYNVSAERIRQIEAIAMQKMKKLLQDYND